MGVSVGRGGLVAVSGIGVAAGAHAASAMMSTHTIKSLDFDERAMMFLSNQTAEVLTKHFGSRSGALFAGPFSAAKFKPGLFCGSGDVTFGIPLTLPEDQSRVFGGCGAVHMSLVLIERGNRRGGAD